MGKTGHLKKLGSVTTVTAVTGVTAVTTVTDDVRLPERLLPAATTPATTTSSSSSATSSSSVTTPSAHATMMLAYVSARLSSRAHEPAGRSRQADRDRHTERGAVPEHYAIRCPRCRHLLAMCVAGEQVIRHRGREWVGRAWSIRCERCGGLWRADAVPASTSSADGADQLRSNEASTSSRSAARGDQVLPDPADQGTIR